MTFPGGPASGRGDGHKHGLARGSALARHRGRGTGPGRAEPDLTTERNVYTAIFAVKFPCKAAGGERDVVLFETGDPRFARLRALLGTIFQPYPPPPGLPVEKASVIARGRLPCESAVGPSRPLEAWYFVPESFGRAPYQFEATSGAPAFAAALAVLDEILTDPANVAGVERNETVRTMTAAVVDKAAVLVAQGRLSGAAAVLKPKVGRDAGGKEAWHWMYRALTRFDYFGSPGTATEKVVGVTDVAFSMKPGFTYQMCVDGPSMTDLGRLDSFTVRIFDLPQQLGPAGSVTRRGYVDVPALRAPVYSRWERVEPPPAPAAKPKP